MQSLVQRIAATVDRYAMFGPARQIGVAVSGGADSVCLVHVLRELAPRKGWQLTVLHVDHQLRGAESSGDAGFVRALAERLGLPLVARAVSLEGSGNLEQNGRHARLEFFREMIAGGTVERVATGHTLSDQAETVLFRLLRGSGTAGLAGVRPVTSDGLARPLIEVNRAQVEAYLTERDIPWREDSTNSERKFARNRIRHELLPQLTRDWNPEIAAALARTGEQAAADEEYWRGEMDRVAAEAFTFQDGAVLVSASELSALPEAVAGRVVRRAIEQAKGDLLGIGFTHVQEVLHLASNPRGYGRVQATGLDICRSFDQLRFTSADAVALETGEGVQYRVYPGIPGLVGIPGTKLAFCLELVEKPETSDDSQCVYNVVMGCVDWGRVSGALAFRSWLPGDRYQPQGSPGVKKLKVLFQLARIPSWERFHWPVLVDGDEIVWTRFGAAAGYAPGPDTRTLLRIQEVKTT